MKKFKVSIRRLDGEIYIENDIYEETFDKAYNAFVHSNKPLPYSKVCVFGGLLSGDKFYAPPHYEGHKSNKDFEKEKTV